MKIKYNKEIIDIREYKQEEITITINMDTHEFTILKRLMLNEDTEDDEMIRIRKTIFDLET